MRVKKKKRLRGCQVVWCGSDDQNGSEWLEGSDGGWCMPWHT